jgi:hypothetical protein
MYRKLASIFLLSSALLLTACSGDAGNGSGDTSAEATSDGADSQEASDGKQLFEIGETADIETFEWGVPYQVSVKSVDFTDEYDGMAYDELVLNAPETLSIVVADTVITNSGDEPMVPGEYIDIPRANTAIAHEDERGFGPGSDFFFDFAEEGLSEELAPGEEVEVPLVFTLDMTDVDDPEGRIFIQFNRLAQTDSISFAVPTP